MDSQKIADLLKQKREKLGLNIPTVVEGTKIKRSYIEAMESGNLDAFDYPILAKNFVRTYARFLKLPDAEILPFLVEIAPAEPVSEGAAAARRVAEKREAVAAARTTDAGVGKKWTSTAFLAAATAILGAGFYHFYKPAGPPPANPAEEQPAASAVPATDTAGAATSDTTADTVAAQSAATATPIREHTVEMRATTDVWVYCESDRHRMEKVIRPGDRFTVTFEKKFHIRAGNAPALKMTIDGKEMSVEGERKVMDRSYVVTEDGRVVIEPPESGSARR